ncbi:MAG: 50S ribosomal protein L6, partial [Burkholderiaceae bacterium]
MSRIAKYPVPLPKGVEATIATEQITVKGPLGTLTQTLNGDVLIENQNNELSFKVANESREAKAMSGTLRALVSNMVQGVSQGFEKKLSLIGVGYKAAAQGKSLNLSLGFSHPVDYALPEGIKAETPTPTEIVIKGIAKQRVG